MKVSVKAGMAQTTANAFVWRRVASDLAQLFVGVEIPAQPTPTITQVRLVDKGTRLLYSGATAPTLTINAPEDGITGDVWDDGGTGSCIYHGSIADPTFGGFGALYATGAGAYCGGPGSITYAYAYQAGVAAYVSTDAQPTTQPPLYWPRPGEGTNGEPVATTKDRAHSNVVNDPDAYGPVIARLDCLLGGDSVDPTGLCIKIPSCRTDTFQACRTRLQNAGFTGTITKHTLSADDAIMEDQADRITATSPAAGTQTEHDTDITVYVNPDPMPTMTATDTLVATALEQNNSSVDPDPQTGKPRAAWKTIARTCTKAVDASGISGLKASDCASLPIFVTGADAADPAKNDAQAIIDRPKWLLLHNWDSPPKNTTWYINKKFENGPGCLAAENPRFADIQGTHCDEYPFWPTIQGYGGPLGYTGGGAPRPRIAWTRGSQNSLQGRALGYWMRGGPATSFGSLFPRCDIRKLTTAQVGAAKLVPFVPPEITLLASGFLNAPIGQHAEGTKTMGLCNKPAAP